MLQVSIGQCIDFRYDYDNHRFQVSSYHYLDLSVSKVRSLE
jgi:hypothetical protein